MESIASSRFFPARLGVPLIAGLILACYWPALTGGFVWDDAAHVTRPELQGWDGLWRIWTDPHATQQYYPVLHSAFWLEHRLWGDAPLGYHLINVGLHFAACCLFALLLRRLWQGAAKLPVPPGVEWLAAAIFAVHPVCVESVAWISEQKNTLSLVFSLLAAIEFLRFHPGRRWTVYARATVFFLLALGSKSVTATLPAALLVILWWQHGRIFLRRDIMPLAPWLVAGISAGLGTAWIERTLIGAQGGEYSLTLVERAWLAGRVIWFYLGKLAWPQPLMFVYPRWDVTTLAATGTLALLAAAIVTIGLLVLSRRSRGPLACWLLYVGTLFPALGFFNVYPFRFSYVADHFQYHAALAVIAAAALGLALAVRSAGAARPILLVGAGTGLLGLTFAANRQAAEYRDGPTLYRATLAKNPACWMAHNNLAVELAKQPGRRGEALEHYEAALRLNPDYADAQNNYGLALALTPGRESEAVAHYRAALRLQPDLAEAHVNLANDLAATPEGLDEAIAHYTVALRANPRAATVHYALANALAKIPGRRDEAVDEYRTALRLDPRMAIAEVNLANTLASIPARRHEAWAHYGAALRLDPASATAHYDFALQLSTEPGREAEVIAHYQEAVRLRPDYARAHNNLAVAYAQLGRFDEARQHWEQALQIDPEFGEARRNLEILRRRQQR